MSPDRELVVIVQSVPMTTNTADDKVYSTQLYVIKFVSDLRRSVVFSGSTKKKWLPWYNWNIVESGVKHHKPNLSHMKHIILIGLLLFNVTFRMFSSYNMTSRYNWYNRCLFMCFKLFFDDTLTSNNIPFGILSSFNRPISDEPTKSLGINTEYMPIGIVLLVNIFNCFICDWRSKINGRLYYMTLSQTVVRC